MERWQKFYWRAILRPFSHWGVPLRIVKGLHLFLFSLSNSEHEVKVFPYHMLPSWHTASPQAQNQQGQQTMDWNLQHHEDQ
jgi:hypothetical protein